MAIDPNTGQPFPPQYPNPQNPGSQNPNAQPGGPYGQPPQDQGYPPQGQQYPPQGQQYPPPGNQGYPPQGNQGYPPPGQQYPPQSYPPQGGYPPQAGYPGYGPGQGSPTPQRPSHTGRNVLALLLVLALVGGIGYAFLRHQQEATRMDALGKQVLAEAPVIVRQDDPSLGDGDKAVAASGPCSFLSAAEVSGLTPDHRHVDAVADQDDCNYMVAGTADTLQGVHMAMLMKAHGLDVGEAAAKAGDKTGTAALLTVSFLKEGGGAAFKELKGKVASGQLEDLPGLGDQAWSGSDTVTSILKGDEVLVLNYVNCPCLAKDVKPLAVKAAAKL